MEVDKQIKNLLQNITVGIYEKEQIVAMALLSAVAGESIFLLGPPGTAKSLVSRRLKYAFDNEQTFEYLMSRFSTPDEIFGPVSISLLKNEDKYERVTDGYLPTASVVFLDEIWKAGPAIQNSLLTAINEKIFQNGNKTIQLPMKALIAASNELPAENEGLEALWDRFLIRMVSNNIDNERTFYKMIRQQKAPEVQVADELKISGQQYRDWQDEIAGIEIPDTICLVVTAIRKQLAEAVEKEDVSAMDYYVSDRRWKKCFHLMQASAFLNGRTSIDITDVVILFHCLWNKADLIPFTVKTVAESIVAPIMKQLAQVERNIKRTISDKQSAKKEAGETKQTERFATTDLFYYSLQNFPSGKCVFSRLGYLHLSSKEETEGIVYFDTYRNNWVVNPINTGKPFDYKMKNATQVTSVTLKRIYGGIEVDGIPYAFESNKDAAAAETKEQNNFFAEAPLDNEERLINETLQPMLNSFVALFESTDNIFLSKLDIKVVKEQLKKCDAQIAELKAKLINTRQLLQA